MYNVRVIQTDNRERKFQLTAANSEDITRMILVKYAENCDMDLIASIEIFQL